MREHHGVHAAPPAAEQVFAGRVAGVFQRAGATAVYHHRVLPVKRQRTRALPHVEEYEALFALPGGGGAEDDRAEGHGAGGGRRERPQLLPLPPQ